MANEIKVQTQPVEADLTVKVVVRNTSGSVWNGSTFVAFADVDMDTYGVALTEQGTASGFYVGDFPTAITTAGTYSVVAYKQLGAELAVTDTVIAEGEIVWSGSSEVTADASDDLITLSYFKLVNGITSTANDARYSALITAASKAIVRATRKHFTLKSYVEFHNARNYAMGTPDYFGNSDFSWSIMTDHYPITELTQITLWPYEPTLTTVIDGSNYIVDCPTGEIRLKPLAAQMALFPLGFQSVKVEYQAGYATVPEDIQQACALMVQNLFSTAGRDLTVSEEDIGDYSYKLRGAMMNLVRSPEVEALIAPHRDHVV